MWRHRRDKRVRETVKSRLRGAGGCAAEQKIQANMLKKGYRSILGQQSILKMAKREGNVGEGMYDGRHGRKLRTYLELLAMCTSSGTAGEELTEHETSSWQIRNRERFGEGVGERGIQVQRSHVFNRREERSGGRARLTERRECSK
ncbi:hypothetical protein M413DRAFT_377891 [Hebeloma cylindrosporum]|uniref:Uncharacterized protein n=1 Tax=Hebeloma cylindrosporum TaxID=76867 RepID=A0A0C3CJI4_HEBCY|nr:hypothetical protein M413DRAFT_377891 [Hebeloma cylindrosporum h7]